MISYPFAKLLSDEIHKTNPNAKIQWYQTWGRPYGDKDRCEEIPEVCTFNGKKIMHNNIKNLGHFKRSNYKQLRCRQNHL